MKILVTGFTPFGEESINPAWEVVSSLPKAYLGAQLVPLCIPTAFERCLEPLLRAVDEEQVDAVVLVGQAGGRTCVTPEFAAINWQEARIPDNDGFQPQGHPLEAQGPCAYFATLPVHQMVAAIQGEGLPATLSYTAGTFVCNAVFYRVLHSLAQQKRDLPAGFIHVPFIPSQTADKPQYASMNPQDIQQALLAALRVLIEPSKSPRPMAALGTTH
ncbi:Pyrrolidone-carboxylate peptidase [Clostridiaceae bacterium JG1575]|nr:Pyrrolidone-carboxylate peptidase [Clostridiaceae bacterium JG1575]